MSSKRAFSISVRELVEFVVRSGNLAADRDFFRPSRALEGTRAHQRLQKIRPEGYQAEVAVSHRIETAKLILTIKGRIDGVLPADNRVLVEEIKSTVGDSPGVPDPVHWAQAKVYAFIHLDQHPFEEAEIQLTYVSLDTGAISEHRHVQTRSALKEFFETVSSIYIAWLEEYASWCDLRDESIRALGFPFPHYRPGQRKLAVAAYRTLANGGKLFAEAPTGIGKTASVLLPAVKAHGEGRFSKIFYLTAKTIGRAAAEKAFAEMRAAGLRFRSLTLTAREKLCVQNGRPCDRRTCPLAIGYYDRLKPALRDLLAHESLTRPCLEAVAQQHQVCPSALSLDAAFWVDAIICDYNYVFDPQASLRQFFAEATEEYAFLVDEAHNLVERARDMFSAELDQGEILQVKRSIAGKLPRCARALQALSRFLTRLKTAHQPDAKGTWRNGSVLDGLPAQLSPLLGNFIEQAEVWLHLNLDSPFRQELLELYFKATSFLRTAQAYGPNYATLLQPSGHCVRLRLFCLDPGPFLRDALDRAKAAVFFSATLRPMEYFRDILGGDPGDAILELSSPFPPEHLDVLIEDQIATDFKTRGQTLDRVARAIASLIGGKHGNYLAYFPSYQYLNDVLTRFRNLSPDADILAQSSQMKEDERESFVAAFHEKRPRTLVGFAVMGGIFGESIDLVGERLVGAMVVGVGLPQVCLDRELIRAYFEQKNGMGFEYAYVYPGMNRVLQAVGRVIRSEHDRGAALLIDARFRLAQYHRLLPRWWNVTVVRGDEDVAKAASAFWQQARASERS